MIIHWEMCPGAEKLAAMRHLAKNLSRYYGMQVLVKYIGQSWTMYAEPGESGEFTNWELSQIESYAKDMDTMLKYFYLGMQHQQLVTLRSLAAQDKPRKKK